MRESRWISICLLACSLFGSTLSAQARGGNAANPTIPTQIPDASHPDGSIENDPQFGAQRDDPRSAMDQRAAKEMEKERSKQRWIEIKKQSEKLLEVATELKQLVDKSGENVLSLEVIKKAEQLEKLSKDLQKRIKNN